MDLAVLVASLVFYTVVGLFLDYFNWKTSAYYIHLITKINVILLVVDLIRRYWRLPLIKFVICQVCLAILTGAGYYLKNYFVYDTMRYLFVLNACAILIRLVTEY